MLKKAIYYRTCDICGKVFTTNKSFQKRCSKECIQEERRRYYYLRKENLQYPEKICQQCGKPFKPTRKNQKLCSVKCRTIWNVKNFKHYGGYGGKVEDIYFDQRTQTKYYVKDCQVVAEDQSGIKIVERCVSETAANKALNRLSMSLGYLPLLCEVQASRLQNH